MAQKNYNKCSKNDHIIIIIMLKTDYQLVANDRKSRILFECMDFYYR